MRVIPRSISRRASRLALGGLLTLSSIGGVTLATTGVASAAAGPYYTTASPYLNARSGPGTGYSIVGTLNYWSPIYIQCQVQGGTNVNGNATWDKLSNGWWISDYWTTTPSYNSYISGVPDCNAAPAPTSTRESLAVSRATSMLGQQYQPGTSTPWDGWCDKFAAYAFGRTASGYYTAYAHYLDLRNRGAMHPGDTNAPAGALVFFDRTSKNGYAGHVMVSLGGGYFATTTFNGYAGSYPGRISKVTLGWGTTYSGPYLGWAYAVNW